MPAVQIGRSRLKKRHEFLRIQRSGTRFRGRFLVFTGRPSSEGARLGKFGLVATKSIGKAHVRNQIKRRLRHLLTLYPNILASRDIVIFAMNSCVDTSFENLKNDFASACAYLDAISKANQRKNRSHIKP